MALLFLLPCLLAALSLTVSHALLPVPPHYKQCDPRWGSDTIGQVNVSKQDDSTICHVGCAMTSLSMLLATVNTTTTWLKDSQHTVTPKSLNVWLQHHQGYDCVSVHQDKECFDLMSAAIGNLTGRIVYDTYMYTTEMPSIEDMSHYLSTQQKAYIAHVHDNHHFVYVTGVNVASNTVSVLDPYFNVTEYPYANVTGALVYTLRVDAVPVQYPTYKQCDVEWGPDVIVNETVCAVGCLMSSTSMALAGHGIDVNTFSSNPGSLNQWLKTHGTWVWCCQMVRWGVPTGIVLIEKAGCFCGFCVFCVLFFVSGAMFRGLQTGIPTTMILKKMSW